MACSHNVVFLLDTTGSVQKARLHMGTLKILNYLGCSFGLSKVRWGFKFFDSLGAQGRISRVGSFRELGSRSWEDFEEELEAKFENRYHAPNLPGPSPRATLTRNILKETLLDYQWDRPEIASPAKPVLRSQKSKLTVTSEKHPASSNPSEGFMNTIFLFSPCPHSQRELLQFVSGSHACLSDELPAAQDLTEKFIPKRIQEMMAAQKITLHWVDTTDESMLLDSVDHVGYHVLAELMHILRGIILPSEVFTQCLTYHSKRTLPTFPFESMSPDPLFSSWPTILPLDSTLSYLFSSASALQALFPQLEGQLFVKRDGIKKPQMCAVTLEPLTVSQRHFENPIHISVKCTVAGWNMMHASNFHTEHWIIRSSPLGQSVHEASLFQHLARCIQAQGLHLVAEVSPSGSCPPCTGIVSPISDTAAVLSLLCAENSAEVERYLLQTAEEGSLPKLNDFSFPEMASIMLNQVKYSEESDLTSPENPLPVWAQQELSRTHRWTPVVTEGWYPWSNLWGGSSHLMESLRSLQAAPVTVEESSKPEIELTQNLSEFYRRRSSEDSAASRQRDRKKRRGTPRTPVRQKMKTMPRSLQMLNVARLNVKAQKLQPDEELTASEKVTQRLLPRRSDDRGEEKGRTVKTKLDFKTEEEIVSYATASYQKAVAEGENLSLCAHDIVAAVNGFQITVEAQERLVGGWTRSMQSVCAMGGVFPFVERERGTTSRFFDIKQFDAFTIESGSGYKFNVKAAWTDAIRSSLLKTSKGLRQQLGNSPDKQLKIRECQLQVYLRLEMSRQCPLIQNSTDEMEQLVEEMIEMLRILCLTEDAAYLTKFLEGLVEMYIESIPKTLGSLYYSLGTQVPPKLASVLPADFFGDDSISQESQAASLPASTASDPAARSASVSNEAELLQELRTRSAKKRKSMLSRHRSVTEASQNLRQIEIPQVSKIRARKDSSRAPLDVKPSPAAQKTPVQEVTKVRRNLFNEGMQSPSKRAGKRFPRSQSVSALEGLKHKHSQSNEAPRDHHKLLTKQVAETPLHKQISRRQLHRQIQGRCSDPGYEVGVVEESPEKALTCGLRRSPRIKQLALGRTFSGSFPSSQAIVKNVQRVHSAHLEGPGPPEESAGWALSSPKKNIQSPRSLLFGALHEAPTSEAMESRRTRRKSVVSDDTVAYQTPRKTPRRTSERFLSPPGNIPRRSPQIRERSQQILLKSLPPKQTVAKNLGGLFSPPKQKRKPSPESVEKKEDYLALSPLLKENVSPPCRAQQLCTPGKQATGDGLDEVFRSPSNGSNSISYIVPTVSFPSSPWGKSPSDLHSPQRSLRTAQKPASARRETPEAESPREPKPLPLLTSASVSSDLTPRKLGGGPVSPKSAKALPPQALLSSFPSSLHTQLRTGNALSPPRAQELDRETSTPRKSPLKPQSASGSTLLKSVLSPSKDPLCAHGSKEEPPQWGMSINLSTETNSFCKAVVNESVSLLQRCEQTSGTMSPSQRGSESHLSPKILAKDSRCVLDAVEVCERLDPSALADKESHKSYSNGSPVQEGPRASEGTVLPTEKCLGLQQPFSQSLSRCNMKSSAPKPGLCTYALRCTPDRRQREAAARLGSLETMADLIAPQSACPLPSAASPPAYEVQLEMQASGLPKLRFKRVGSGAPTEPQSQAEARKLKGEGSDLDAGDLSVSWCGRHSGKPEPVCISPSCFRSAHSTPGKVGGGQTYICQSYTPSRCISSSISPSDGNAGISWTPSPKQKGKVTPEAIKDWPRRKRATIGCNRTERQADPAGEIPAADQAGVRTAELVSGSKALGGGEFELEGVCRLQDLSPCSDTETCRDEHVHKGTFGLRSRKRVFEHLSPEEEAGWEVKRACPERENPATHPAELFSIGQIRTNLENQDAFNFSGLTPPSSVKSSISASGLLALTQSPLLYQGHARSQRKRLPEDGSDGLGAASKDLSPFHNAPSRRRALSRTYSRKRLLS